MKKLLLALVCVFSLSLVACGGGSGEDKALDLVNSTIKKLDKANSLEDFMKIGTEFEEKAMKLAEKYPELDESESEALEDAMDRLEKAGKAAQKRCVGNLDLDDLDLDDLDLDDLDLDDIDLSDLFD